MKEDQEFKEFRDLMETPEKFEDGFGWGSVFMAFFVGLLMVPAQMYMQLVAGIHMGSAAQWVTVILYVEVARRAFTTLKRPEIFVLFYMCGAVISTSYGGIGMLWHQFLVQSEEMRKMGITEYIPQWFAPSDPAVLSQRNFLMMPWLAPIGLILFGMFMNRINNFGLGYIVFRLSSDVEKLPFPMAPVQAMGMTALADASGEKETWRWRTFCIGGVAGITFGFFYLAIPNITGAIFSRPLQILPLPFVDLTHYSERVLPAMPMMISFDLGFVVTGMVLPFWAMVGSFIGLIFTVILNPVLYHSGVLGNWEKGVGAIRTIQSNLMDFYFSFGLGLAIAIGIIGFIHMYSSFRKSKQANADLNVGSKLKWRRLFEPPAGRGDFPIWIAILIYVGSSVLYVGLFYWLVNYCAGPLYGPKFPMWLIICYCFVYTPVMAYVSTRMEGIVGQQMPIPFVREATLILSGYKGAAIWFAPLPWYNYSYQALSFKTMSLTGTKFTSLIKAELLIMPIMALGIVVFSQFIWAIANVPSEMFPFANKFWELGAFQQGIIFSATLPGEAISPFKEAFHPRFIIAGLTLALVVYGILNHFGLPIFLVYGVVRGLDQSLPHAITPMFIGAILGRFVFSKWFKGNWPRYRIVFASGFAAGMGLITMLSLGIVFMTKSVIKLPM